MARMHSRRKGKSSSTKPSKKSVPSWVRYKPQEIELLITKIAKEGKSASQIGTILRDSYGIPDVKTVAKKSISSILKEKGVSKELPEDVLALIKRAVLIRKHLEENPKDNTAKRGLLLTESKINRLIKYYKRTGKVSESWKYDPKKATMFLE